MTEYFYTLDLGETCGSKLERLAAQAGEDDVEAFAAMILCGALDLMEARVESDALTVDDGSLKPAENQGSPRTPKEEDDLPF